MRSGPVNPGLRNLIQELKKKASQEKVNLWKRVAQDLEKPSRQRRIVNLSRINLYAQDNEVVLVPGKVLGNGLLNKKVEIAAYQFSSSALDKIRQSQSKTLTLWELMKTNPKGKNIRIIG